MNTNLLIHIQSPPKEATMESLVKYFSKFGQVVNLRFFKGDYFKDPTAFLSFKQIKSRNEKRSRRAQIDTSTPNSALLECSSAKMKHAILNNVHFFANKAIRVRKYMDEQELSKHIQNIRDTRMFVDNIPPTMDNEGLKAFFSNFGPVKSAYITGDGKANSLTKFGYVIFEEKGILDTLNPSGIHFKSTKLYWSSYYNKNNKASSGSKKSKINKGRNSHQNKNARNRPKPQGRNSQEHFKGKHKPIHAYPLNSSSDQIQNFTDGSLSTESKKYMKNVPNQLAQAFNQYNQPGNSGNCNT